MSFGRPQTRTTYNFDFGGFVDDLAEAGIDAAGNAISNFVGGSGSGPRPNSWQEMYASILEFGRTCPGQPSLVNMAQVVERASDAELARITEALAAGNGGMAPRSREELADPASMALWVVAAMGGNDCESKSAPWLPGYIRELAAKYSGTGEINYETDDTLGNGMPEEPSWTDRAIDIAEANLGIDLDGDGRVAGSTENASQSANVPQTTGGANGIPTPVLLIGAGIAAYFILK